MNMMKMEKEEKTSRSGISLKRKYDVIQAVLEKPPKKKKKDIAAEFDMPQNTLSCILRNKDEIIERYHAQKMHPERKRVRSSVYSDLETALLDWYDKISHSELVSGPVMKEKAERLAKQLGYEDYKCSDGWLSRFKVRNNITWRKGSSKISVEPLASRVEGGDSANSTEIRVEIDVSAEPTQSRIKLEEGIALEEENHEDELRDLYMFVQNKKDTTPKPVARAGISFKRKFDVIQAVQKKSPNKMKKDIAAEFNMPQNTLSRILRDKDEIIERYQAQNTNPDRKRVRSSAYSDIEKALWEWYSKISQREIISWPVMREKAERLAKQLGYKDFTCSDGWLSRFKHRNNLIHVYRNSASISSAEPIKSRVELCDPAKPPETGEEFADSGKLTKSREEVNVSVEPTETTLEFGSVESTDSRVKLEKEEIASEEEKNEEEFRDLNMVAQDKYKRPRTKKSASLKCKYDMIQAVLNAPPGTKRKDIASQFNMLPNTLSTILKRKDTIIENYHQKYSNPRRKRLRYSQYNDIEVPLFEWLCSQNVPVSRSRLIKKSLLLAHEKGLKNFKSSAGWLQGFTFRNNIKFNDGIVQIIPSKSIQEDIEWENVRSRDTTEPICSDSVEGPIEKESVTPVDISSSEMGESVIESEILQPRSPVQVFPETMHLNLLCTEEDTDESEIIEVEDEVDNAEDNMVSSAEALTAIITLKKYFSQTDLGEEPLNVLDKMENVTRSIKVMETVKQKMEKQMRVENKNTKTQDQNKDEEIVVKIENVDQSFSSHQGRVWESLERDDADNIAVKTEFILKDDSMGR